MTETEDHCENNGSNPPPRAERPETSHLVRASAALVILFAACVLILSIRAIVWPVDSLERLPGFLFGTLAAVLLSVEILSIFFRSRLATVLVVCILGLLAFAIAGNLDRQNNLATTALIFAILLVDVLAALCHLHWRSKLKNMS